MKPLLIMSIGKKMRSDGVKVDRYWAWLALICWFILLASFFFTSWWILLNTNAYTLKLLFKIFNILVNITVSHRFLLAKSPCLSFSSNFAYMWLIGLLLNLQMNLVWTNLNDFHWIIQLLTIKISSYRECN